MSYVRAALLTRELVPGRRDVGEADEHSGSGRHVGDRQCTEELQQERSRVGVSRSGEQ